MKKIKRINGCTGHWPPMGYFFWALCGEKDFSEEYFLSDNP